MAKTAGGEIDAEWLRLRRGNGLGALQGAPLLLGRLFLLPHKRLALLAGGFEGIDSEAGSILEFICALGLDEIAALNFADLLLQSFQLALNAVVEAAI
ncbi:MAG: hypothetical protein L0Y58_17620 [Verrucomicrobia subdivision 3 bacterium]|nr:hypothetical protein [Limisphaerales bacterium]